MRIPEYPWLKLIAVRVPIGGEPFIDGMGDVSDFPSTSVQPIVAPDNANNALDLSALKIPEGYEIDGASVAEAFGEVGESQLFLSYGGYVGEGKGDVAITTDYRRIRLRKIAPKTRTWVIAETCDPDLIRQQQMHSHLISEKWAVRFEERHI